MHVCVKREHRNICAVFSASSPHVSIEEAPFLLLLFTASVSSAESVYASPWAIIPLAGSS